MYLLEMLYWKSKTSEDVASSLRTVEREGAGYPNIGQRAEVPPADGFAFFSVGENFIDVQGAWQEDKRGLVTFLFLGVMVVLQYYFLIGAVVPGARSLASGFGALGNPLRADGYIFISIIILMWAFANIMFFRICWRWIRLEIFVQRRIIARFNRVTRQVYINRPAYAGGLVTLPWDATIAEASGGNAASPAGGTLAMVWPASYSGSGFDDYCLIGGTLPDRASAEALWEYIRLFMEEGPNAVPRPARLRSTFPWPWDSVRSTLSFLVPSWRTGDKGLVLTFALLLSPLLLLHSICHWLSLLLCWPTWWPRIIRRAGLPGAPVPKLTTADDYGPEMAAKLRASALKVVDNNSASSGP